MVKVIWKPGENSFNGNHEVLSYEVFGIWIKFVLRFTAAEQDLALAQKALRKRESVDNSAVKTADKLQKEVTAKRSLVDTLQSKIRWYQEQIDTLLKVNKALILFSNRQIQATFHSKNREILC